MAKRIGVGAVLACLAILLVVLLLWRDHLPGIAVTIRPKPPAASHPAAPTQTQQRPTSSQGDPAVANGPDSSADPVPLNILDHALDSATSGIQVPEGIQSGDIPEDNALHWFLIAAENMPTPGEGYSELRDELLEKGWHDDPRMLELFDQCKTAFEAIRKGVAVGKIDFPPADVDEPLPYLSKWRELSRLMTLQAQMYRSQGNYEAAIDNLATTLEFGNISGHDSFIISQLVGTAIQNIAAPEMCKLLQSPRVSADQCRAITARLNVLEPIAPTMAEAVRAEADVFELWYRRYSSDENFNKIAEMAMLGGGASGKSGTNEQCRQQFQQMISIVRQSADLVQAPVYTFDNAAFQRLAAGNVFTARILENYPRLVEADARAKTIRAGVTVVAAIETYHRENGAYPQSLDDLAPSVLTQLPADPFTGQPLHYARKGNSYQLYSAGTNMRDDGGHGDPWIYKHDDYVIVDGTGN